MTQSPNAPQDEAILGAIPHRRPMLLIDRIVERDEKRIVCEKTFHDSEFFLEGHYPDFPLVPGVILCECAMQAGAVLLSDYADDNSERVPVATRMNDVKFRRMVRPGQTIEIEAILTEQMGDAFFLTGKVRCEGKLAARLDFGCAMAPKPQ